MKKSFTYLFLVCVIVAVIGGYCFAEDRTIDTTVIFDAVTLTNNMTATSAVINLNQRKPIGFFSLQMNLDGTGVVTSVTYQLSNDGASFSTPVGAANIVSNFTTNSGANSDGNSTYGFTPILSKFMRILAVATGTSVDVTGTLAIQ